VCHTCQTCLLKNDWEYCAPSIPSAADRPSNESDFATTLSVFNNSRVMLKTCANRRYRIFAVIAIIINTVIFLTFMWMRSETVTPSFLELDDEPIFNNKPQRLIWFRLLINSTSGQPYRGTTASSVMLPSDFNVDQFRKTVKAEYNQPGYLKDIPAGAVLVYKNSAAFTRKEHPLNSSTILNDFGTTEDEALIVLVPTSSSSNESLNSTLDEKRTRPQKSSSFQANNTDQQLENVTSATEKYVVCVLSRFNNANYLIPQWIQYHVFAGVGHFFLVDDCSSSDSRREQFLTDCSKRGYCTIEIGSKTDCANEKIHFNFLFQKYGHECLWTTVIDADEYMFLYNFNAGDNVLNFLPQFLQQNPSEGMIKMPWYVLGSNGYEQRPSGLLIDLYLSGNWDIQFKTLIMSEYVQEWKFSHKPTKLREDRQMNMSWVDKFRKNPTDFRSTEDELNTTATCPRPVSMLYLKHYRPLSWEDFKSERAARNVTSSGVANIAKKQGRQKWEQMSFYNRFKMCSIPSEPFRQQMSNLFSNAFKVNCWNDNAKLEFVVPTFQ
jgi:hypothetical protein